MSNYMDTAFGTPPWDTTEADKFESEIEATKKDVLEWIGCLDKLGESTLEQNTDYTDIIWEAIKDHTSDGEIQDAIFEDIMQEMNDLGW